MTEVATLAPRIPAMSAAAIAKVRAFENGALATPQIPAGTHHVLHAGIYARTMLLRAGEYLTGALVKIATTLIVQGDARVWIGESTQRITGYAVLPASANRKQVFVAVQDTHITMIFPTAAKTVEEAERVFTDEYERLASRRDEAINHVIITGE